MHLFNNVAFLKRSPLILWTIFLAVAPCVQSAVVINEIMYHPSSENTDEEFIELYNSGGADVDISGWKFTSGVDFNLDVVTSDTFTAASLASLAKAGMMVRKSATDDAKEKLAIDSMKITSDSNNLKLGFKTDETKFQALLNSDLFKAVSK